MRATLRNYNLTITIKIITRTITITKFKTTKRLRCFAWQTIKNDKEENMLSINQTNFWGCCCCSCSVVISWCQHQLTDQPTKTPNLVEPVFQKILKQILKSKTGFFAVFHWLFYNKNKFKSYWSMIEIVFILKQVSTTKINKSINA